MSRVQVHLRCVLVLACWCLFILMIPCNAFPSEQSVVDGDRLSVEVGFSNKVKLGVLSPIFIDYEGSQPAKKYAVRCLDGNGTPVNYEGTLESSAEDRLQGWFKLGRNDAKFKLTLFDEADNILAEKTVAEFELLDSTVPMVLTIESGNTLSSAIKSIENQLFDNKCELIQIDSGSQLPIRAISYQAIKVIYLATSDLSLVNSISDSQLQALLQWCRRGGKLIVASGVHCETIFKNNKSKWAQLLPGEFQGSLDISNSSQLELFTRSDTPLLQRDSPPIPACELKNPIGNTELKLASRPMVIRRPLDFGQLVFSGIDIDTTPMTKWAGYRNFLLRLTYGNLNLNLNKSNAEKTQSRRVTRVAYGDIMGQLILPLERFTQVKFINFTVVALLIALFVLCVGPGDFFLLKNVFKRMELTWVTFSLLTIGFCLLALLMSRYTKPDKIQVNQLEVIDIEPENRTVRGNFWSNIYSPNNLACDVKLKSQNDLGIDVSQSSLCWQGVPGAGLGGMKSGSAQPTLSQGYSCQLAGRSKAAELNGLPIRVSATKTISGEYFDQIDLQPNSRLRLNRRTNRLQGTFTNPLDVEIKQSCLLFENWIYVRGEPLLPGDTINIVSEMTERPASSYFSRRVTSDSDKGGNTPWNPLDTDMRRIAEIMMFFSAAG
ncbi:MAG: hypothetical protein AAGA30_14755, partial [Planctomycetota bacterium]